MCADTPDYKDTLNLPETDFPMRAGLPQREPQWLARWEEIGVYDRLREKEGRKPFILHDGPPYANGHLHIGHALNKTIKDMIVRSHQMMGLTRAMFRVGTVTACRSNGRSRKNTAPRARTRTRSTLSISVRNAASLPKVGLISSVKSSNVWASPATGRILI